MKGKIYNRNVATSSAINRSITQVAENVLGTNVRSYPKEIIVDHVLHICTPVLYRLQQMLVKRRKMFHENLLMH